VPDQDGKHDFLRRIFKGQKVVLYFYPQDNDTPTCTKEACNLRDNHALLTERGFCRLGCKCGFGEGSPENSYRNLTCPSRYWRIHNTKIIQKYNVLGRKKTTFGKTYDGVHRTTYIIDEKGKNRACDLPSRIGVGMLSRCVGIVCLKLDPTSWCHSHLAHQQRTRAKRANPRVSQMTA
jgi:peroxiredoxin Q/BCP